MGPFEFENLIEAHVLEFLASHGWIFPNAHIIASPESVRTIISVQTEPTESDFKWLSHLRPAQRLQIAASRKQ
jgi:hypothetical protein